MAQKIDNLTQYDAKKMIEEQCLEMGVKRPDGMPKPKGDKAKVEAMRLRQKENAEHYKRDL